MTAKINLFCLPFAGGSRYSYALFNRYAPTDVELVPIDIPGRGTRFSEPLLDEMKAIADDVFEQIRGQLDSPFAFFGHSMGTILCYLLCEKLERHGLPMPIHVFLSGRGGPASESRKRSWHALPKDEFREKLFELGGSPGEVLQEERLMEFVEPILRADFKAVEHFSYGEIHRFDVPLTVMIGKEEKITLDEAFSWQEISSIPLSFHAFEGGHFFIFDHPARMMELLALELKLEYKQI